MLRGRRFDARGGGSRSSCGWKVEHLPNGIQSKEYAWRVRLVSTLLAKFGRSFSLHAAISSYKARQGRMERQQTTLTD